MFILPSFGLMALVLFGPYAQASSLCSLLFRPFPNLERFEVRELIDGLLLKNEQLKEAEGLGRALQAQMRKEAKTSFSETIFSETGHYIQIPGLRLHDRMQIEKWAESYPFGSRLHFKTFLKGGVLVEGARVDLLNMMLEFAVDPNTPFQGIKLSQMSIASLFEAVLRKASSATEGMYSDLWAKFNLLLLNPENISLLMLVPLFLHWKTENPHLNEVFLNMPVGEMSLPIHSSEANSFRRSYGKDVENISSLSGKRKEAWNEVLQNHKTLLMKLKSMMDQEGIPYQSLDLSASGREILLNTSFEGWIRLLGRLEIDHEFQRNFAHIGFITIKWKGHSLNTVMRTLSVD
jgi:hypothetical protein